MQRNTRCLEEEGSRTPGKEAHCIANTEEEAMVKIRDLKRILRRRGYRMRKGRGSHCVWSHPAHARRPIVLPDSDHEDAHPYQIARVRKAQGKKPTAG